MIYDLAYMDEDFIEEMNNLHDLYVDELEDEYQDSPCSETQIILERSCQDGVELTIRFTAGALSVDEICQVLRVLQEKS